MVEGHQCARVVHWHRSKLVSKAFRATSPNGRFKDGAAKIDNAVLTRAEHIGKNLFYFFERKNEPTQVVHIHFGMSGRFRTWALGEEPETTATTRLRIAAVDGSVGGHVSAMTVNIGTMELYEEKEAELGPDPLRPDADPERFFAKMDTARGGAKPVGLALMDQSWIAGVGNIYRAEILFRAGVHPEEPCSALSRDARTRIWNESVVCLQRGFETGSILTVDPAEGLPEPWKRRYIYNHKACGRCGGPVLSWDMANRTAYACGGKCQPLMVEGGVGALTAPRRKALAAAKKHVSFVSHCAPEPAPNAKGKGKVETDANQLHVGADVEDAGEPSDDVDNIGVLPTPATPAAARAIASTAETPTPGARARRMVGPSAAAAEKARAGEKKNVEHVALEDATEEPAAPADPSRRASKRARKL